MGGILAFFSGVLFCFFLLITAIIGKTIVGSGLLLKITGLLWMLFLAIGTLLFAIGISPAYRDDTDTDGDLYDHFAGSEGDTDWGPGIGWISFVVAFFLQLGPTAMAFSGQYRSDAPP